MSTQRTAFPPHIRLLLIAIWPPIAGFALQLLFPASEDQIFSRAPIYAGVGIVSWLLGIRWYGVQGMGVRGGRPLMAGIGFAFLGWLAVLLARFLFIDYPIIASGGLLRVFIYLLLFEAFCTQLWTFGVLYRGLADWRDGRIAMLVSGLLFGAIGYLFFLEAEIAYGVTPVGVAFFLVWGVFYGVVRARTGSVVGIAIVQAMQSLTAWHVALPAEVTSALELNLFYGMAGVLMLIFIWRLWPKREADYRI